MSVDYGDGTLLFQTVDNGNCLEFNEIKIDGDKVRTHADRTLPERFTACASPT